MIHNNLGFLVATTNRSPQSMDEAIYHFRQAVELNPNYAEAHHNLGTLLSNKGQTKEAEEHLRQALNLKPNYPDAERNLGDLLFNMRRFQEAAEAYEQTLRLKPDFTQVYWTLAQTYANLRQPYNAISAVQKGVELARSQGQVELALKMEEWLRAYLAVISDQSGTAPH